MQQLTNSFVFVPFPFPVGQNEVASFPVMGACREADRTLVMARGFGFGWISKLSKNQARFCPGFGLENVRMSKVWGRSSKRLKNNSFTVIV